MGEDCVGVCAEGDGVGGDGEGACVEEAHCGVAALDGLGDVLNWGVSRLLRLYCRYGIDIEIRLLWKCV